MKLRWVFSRALLAGCQETLVALLPASLISTFSIFEIW